jgi:hypothetical protein
VGVAEARQEHEAIGDIAFSPAGGCGMTAELSETQRKALKRVLRAYCNLLEALNAAHSESAATAADIVECLVWIEQTALRLGMVDEADAARDGATQLVKKFTAEIAGDVAKNLFEAGKFVKGATANEN